MAMIELTVGTGPESWVFSVSDVYGDPAREYRTALDSWNRIQSLKWCPERKPKGWWWRRYFIGTQEGTEKV